MTVYVVTVEGNTDFFSEVLGVYSTLEKADVVRQEAIARALDAGHRVAGINHDDDFEWTRDYNIESFNLDDEEPK